MLDYRLSIIGPIFFLCLSVSEPATSKNDRLWLPVSYQQHYARLVEAAAKVSELDGCYHLLKGTLSEEKTSGNNVVFSFRCRDATRNVFTVNVFAKDLRIVKVSDIWFEQEMIEKEAEKQRKLRQRLANRDQYWALCYKTFQQETQTFNQVKVITPVPPKPDINSDGGFIYLIEFQTMSLKKNRLSYLATAEVYTLSECKLEIRPT